MLVTSVKCVLVCFLLAATSSAQNPTTSSKGTATTSTQRVCLSEILIAAPASDSPAQIAAARSKAEQVRDAICAGGSWADLARTNSQGPSAPQGGTLGCFERGLLAKPIEELVFRMKVGDMSEVLSTKLGFVILQVTGDEPQSILETSQQPVLDGHESGIRGRVVDSFEHVPIRSAYILAHRSGAADAHVRTDGGGKYAMPLPIGIYDVFISADGFSPTSRKIEVTPDGMMVYDAVLEFNSLGML
jgi:hypothetical protein